jgi:4-alpha-glucanotransferase
MACKDAHHGTMWTSWDAPIRQRDPHAIGEWSRKLAPELNAYKYWQFEFFQQWELSKPIASSAPSASWATSPSMSPTTAPTSGLIPNLFYLDDQGRPTVVSGVPPDYFSATGQLWGNPIYRWDLLATTGYKWWIERFRASLALFDMVRLDHFRGFESYWEVPSGESTAIHGRWVKGPGEDFLSALQNAFGGLPIVAENLGVITPPVENCASSSACRA